MDQASSSTLETKRHAGSIPRRGRGPWVPTALKLVLDADKAETESTEHKRVLNADLRWQQAAELNRTLALHQGNALKTRADLGDLLSELKDHTKPGDWLFQLSRWAIDQRTAERAMLDGYERKHPQKKAERLRANEAKRAERNQTNRHECRMDGIGSDDSAIHTDGPGYTAAAVGQSSLEPVMSERSRMRNVAQPDDDNVYARGTPCLKPVVDPGVMIAPGEAATLAKSGDETRRRDGDHGGLEQRPARSAHNAEVDGSNPSPATFDARGDSAAEPCGTAPAANLAPRSDEGGVHGFGRAGLQGRRSPCVSGVRSNSAYQLTLAELYEAANHARAMIERLIGAGAAGLAVLKNFLRAGEEAVGGETTLVGVPDQASAASDTIRLSPPDAATAESPRLLPPLSYSCDRGA